MSTIEEQMATLTMEEKNAALRAAVERRLCGQDGDDEHPVLAEDHEAYDEPDPIRERGWTAAEVVERFAPHPSSRRFLELLDEMAELHRSKSRDYGSEEDPLANIRHGADYVDIEAWRGCMVRIADKVQRLRTYCKTGRLVHEGVRDTLLDLAAYSLLAIVLFEEGDG
jgi:hypothetical protein